MSVFVTNVIYIFSNIVHKDIEIISKHKGRNIKILYFMDTVRDRLKYFIRTIGLTYREFELKCGFSNASVNNIKDSITKKKLDVIKASFPELNTDWLMFGRGEMLVAQADKRSDSCNVYAETLVKALNETIESKSALIDILEGRLEEYKSQIEEYRLRIEKLRADLEEAQKNVRRQVSDVPASLREGM